MDVVGLQIVAIAADTVAFALESAEQTGEG
jgi:hypothetical protein